MVDIHIIIMIKHSSRHIFFGWLVWNFMTLTLRCSTPREVDSHVAARRFPQNTELVNNCVKRFSAARRKTFPTSAEQTVKLHQTLTSLSARQAVSMHHRGPKTRRGSWMCSICLVVAKRATFVESGNQRLPSCLLGYLWLCHQINVF